MAPWTQALLTSYYLATLPARRRAAAERTECGMQPACILFYHRVADEHPNDWTISTRGFERQITWLQARFDLLSLAEVQQRIASGHNRRATACITFDDGYGDNMDFAVPWLVRKKIPFTYFVSTDHVLHGAPFPHDVAAGRPLRPNTPADLRQLAEAGVEIGSHTRSHSDLGAVRMAEQLFDEIHGSKKELEQAISRAVRYFAFPYGLPVNLTTAAFRVAHEAGYLGVASAYGGYNFPGDDPFHLRRFHADTQMIRFMNWMTVDPRKLRCQCDFDPGDYGRPSSCSADDRKIQTAAGVQPVRP